MNRRKTKKLNAKRIQKEFPEMVDGQNYNAIIIGYDMCPHSKRAKDLLTKKNKKYKFISFAFGCDDLQSRRDRLGYSDYGDTMPIILIRNTGGAEWEHIGGADELYAMMD